ncbi:MAG: hypothetical protein ACLS6O_04155 [Bifidobacterium sp.]
MKDDDQSSTRQSTMDNGYGMFRTMLAYSRTSQALVTVDGSTVSQLCSDCSYRNKDTKMYTRWTCPRLRSGMKGVNAATTSAEHDAVRNDNNLREPWAPE